MESFKGLIEKKGNKMKFIQMDRRATLAWMEASIEPNVNSPLT